MSPILDLQRREMEQGRIRFGNKKGNRPNRLDHPLLTSADKSLVDAVAAKYGGTVTPWPGDPDQWQTEVDDDLAILVPVSPEPFSSWWERWSGGGCMRRCDGFKDTINDEPCDCDKNAEQRACKPTTRFVVLLPETGEARWRVETKSLHAALELPERLEPATGDKTGEVVPGVLRVEQRKGKKGKVPVPVVKLSKMSGEGSGVPTLGDGGEVEQRSLPAGNTGEPFEPQSEGDMAPLPSAAPASGSDDIDGAGTKTISQAQIGRLMAVAREHGVSTDDLKLVVFDIAGVRSRKEIPVAKYDQIIAAISGEMVASPRREDIS